MIARYWLIMLLAVMAQGLPAAPRVWVEAQIDPVEVPVNAQATYVLRFGHAVDVREVRISPPDARLAEVAALGPPRQFEATRDGMRQRIHEQRFAVLPFASGDLRIEAAVSASTTAALNEVAGQKTFSLAAPSVRLTVAPAVPGNSWLPAHALRIELTGDAPAGLGIGGVWTRELLIEADGVDGSVIGAPEWAVTADWTLQFDPPVSGRRVQDGRLIGFRRQTIHFQPNRAGSLRLPVARIDWWQMDSSKWTSSSVAGSPVSVLPASTGLAVGPTRPASPAEPASTGTIGWPFAALASIMLMFVTAWRSRWGQLAWQAHTRWREVKRECRNGDARRARAALLKWLPVSRWAVRSTEALAALATDDPALIQALGSLDEACYGREGSARKWDGRALLLSLKSIRRNQPGAFI